MPITILLQLEQLEMIDMLIEKEAKSKTNQTQILDQGSTRLERGIYRVNYPSHKGIRAYLKFKDFEFQKVFSIKEGGERKAIAAAKKWRKERLREIQSMPEAQNPLKKKMSNNTSGITGVQRRETAWIATWVENGKEFHRSFAIEKHGEENAFKFARQTRAAAEKRMFGKVCQEILKNEFSAEISLS